MAAKYGRMIMYHMIADTHEELMEMADRIGVQRKWLQYPGHHREHFDISKGRRALAVQAGAVEITRRELAMKAYERRKDFGTLYFKKAEAA
jgi:hypothetical protein